MKIYNGTNLATAPKGTTPFIDAEMGLFFPENNNSPTPRFTTFDEDHIHSVADAWPDESVVCLDMEGSTRPGSDENGLDQWLYRKVGFSSLAMRWKIYHMIKRRRPDLDLGLWGIPGSWMDVAARRNWRDVRDNTNQDIAHGWFADNDSMYIAAYWRHADVYDAAHLFKWIDALELRIAAANLFYGRDDLKVFICPYRTGQSDATPVRVPSKLLREQMDLLSDLGNDLVFWMPNKVEALTADLAWMLEWYGD